jgi:hypothetical protein
MKRKSMGAALALLMTSGAASADGVPINADDPWAKSIGDGDVVLRVPIARVICYEFPP